MMTTEEKFASWHKDCDVQNDGGRKTVSNHRLWCSPRTCYGNIQIPSHKNCIATWQIRKEVDLKTYPSVTVTVGIDSIQQTSTKFYYNTESPNYGYNRDGKIYEMGKVQTNNVSADSWGNLDIIEMILNTNLGLLTFYKINMNGRKTLQHSCKIKTDPQLTYRLAVCIKDAKVTIMDFKLKQQRFHDHVKKVSSKSYIFHSLHDTIDDEKNDAFQISQEINHKNAIQSLTKDVNATENKFDQLQNKYNDTSQKMKEYEQETLRQREIILSFNKENEETDIKEQQTEYDMDAVNKYINEEMIKFKKLYNETELKKICEKNPGDLTNNNSLLNRNINSYENNIGNIMESLTAFTRCIENTKLIINDLSSLKESEYKTWDIDTMLVWIASIENRRFVKYLDGLRDGFTKSEITKGKYLPDLDVATLSVEPFNINSFPDKRDLVKKFKELRSNDEVEGGTIYH